MAKPESQLPPMPQVGFPESHYAREVHRADKRGDVHARESLKVAQYITLGLDPRLSWPQKLRYFQHALRRHCNPPPLPDEKVWIFYKELAHLVREHCGREALRLASAEDDSYAARLQFGGTRERLSADARLFFATLMGTSERCPEHFTDEDWAALKILRDQWVISLQGDRRVATGE